eukprot:TRINITY_DN3548_c0_g1_i1.p2 TRINITY_DN3548_c0_g1~~TRINITY_DN3548_c0_g1_i1.p2  ORF type:complete len:211 (-),score=30.10 TRINITY_DN3548_c0_g1_i1:78-710(-)
MEAISSLCQNRKHGKYVVSIQSLCDYLEQSPDYVFENLRLLASMMEIGFEFTQNWSQVIEIIQCPQDLSALVGLIQAKLTKSTFQVVKEFDCLVRIFEKVAEKKTSNSQRCCLREQLSEYLSDRERLLQEDDQNQVKVDRKIKLDIKAFLAGAKLRGIEIGNVSVAKVLYGIGSNEWKDSTYWGSHCSMDFETIVGVALEYLQQMRIVDK